MTVSVRIPTPLRGITKGEAQVEASGVTVRQVIEDLEARYPGMRERLMDESGELRRFVNLFVGDEDIRFLQGLETPIEGETLVSIVPAVAGGRGPGRARRR